MNSLSRSQLGHHFPAGKTAEEEQERMYVSNTGNLRRKPSDGTIDDLVNVSCGGGGGGIKARRLWRSLLIPSFLSELKPEPCLREVLERPHKNQAVTGPRCRVFL